jgi:hypothetical protein
MAAEVPLRFRRPPLPVFRILCLVLFATALAIQPGCRDPEEQRNEALRKEIIEVHDRAMDKIGLMFSLEMKLKNEPPAGVKEEEIERRIDALKEANRAMFRWMNQYQTLGIEGDTAADTRYRLDQLEQIKEVGRLTDRAIDEAEQLLSGN